MKLFHSLVQGKRQYTTTHEIQKSIFKLEFHIKYANILWLLSQNMKHVNTFIRIRKFFYCLNMPNFTRHL